MLFVFLLISILIIIIQYRREKNWLNLSSLFIVPYLVLVSINNIIIYRFGFYQISDSVLLMLTCAFSLFYIGSRVFVVNSNTLIKEQDNEERFAEYDIDTMTIFLYIVAIAGLIKAFIMFRNGQFAATTISDVEGTISRGIVGHLLLASYSVLPIVFLYWTYIKKLKYIIPVLGIFLVSFATFIKYNIIGIFVSLFIFLIIYKKSVIKIAVIILVTAAVGIFFVNYAVVFYIRGVFSNATTQFYLEHLWTYMCGSLIYDNYIFTNGVRVGVGISYKLMTFLCALPNMFIGKLFNIKLFPHMRQPDMLTASHGVTSNVVDSIGYLFPSKGSLFDLLLFGIVFLTIGALFSYIYRRNMKNNRKFNTFIANFLCYFVFFSFFGTFYVQSGPWEILVYSLILPNLLYKRKIRFRWGKY